MLSRDPKMYPSPETFNPERFDDPEVLDPHQYIFGFGRRYDLFRALVRSATDPSEPYRICPGQHLADANFWISMAITLAAFNITKSKDAEGREITPSGEYNGSMVP